MNLRKSGKNKFAGFSYYELADFIPAVNEIFNELKLYSAFSVESDKAMLKIVNAENPEENVIFTSPTATVDLKGCTAIQGIGAIHTYMKRYLYMNALEIVEHDALDAQAGEPKSKGLECNIDSIQTVTQLNNAYKFFIESSRGDNSWKKRLMDKCESLNATFNKEFNRFEMISA
jgi:hypothetical protein